MNSLCGIRFFLLVKIIIVIFYRFFGSFFKNFSSFYICNIRSVLNSYITEILCFRVLQKSYLYAFITFLPRRIISSSFPGTLITSSSVIILRLPSPLLCFLPIWKKDSIFSCCSVFTFIVASPVLPDMNLAVSGSLQPKNRCVSQFPKIPTHLQLRDNVLVIE